MTRKISEFTIDEQLAVGTVVLQQLVSLAHKDFSTDPSGYNISKAQLGKLAAKVADNIKRGGLQPSKIVTHF